MEELQRELQGVESELQEVKSEINKVEGDINELKLSGRDPESLKLLQQKELALKPPAPIYIPLLLTARQAILRPVPPIADRLSPRCSSSKTAVARPRTYSSLQHWPNFMAHMSDLEAKLDDTAAVYVPVTVAGNPTVQCFPPAADVSEIRAVLSMISPLVNDVANSMNIPAHLISSRGGRSASNTDWIVRAVSVQPELQQEQQAAGPAPSPNGHDLRPRPQQQHMRVLNNAQRDQKQNSKFAASANVLGCVEVKGPWECQLMAGEHPCTIGGEELEKLEQAIQQCYGDMVMDEAGVGMLWLQNVCVLLMRTSDVKDKTLYISEAIGLDKMLLACLLLLSEAARLKDVKPLLGRAEVPSTCDTTPADSPGDRPGVQENLAMGQPDAQQQKRRRTGTRDREAPPASSTQPPSSCGAGVAHLPLCSFSSVGLTDLLIGSGCYGNVLQGSVDGVPAAIKLYDLRFPNAQEVFLNELQTYTHVRDQQGLLLPRLLKYGVLAHTGAMFLALSDEGLPLPEGPIKPAARAAMSAAVCGLHDAGVLHGDIRRANFVCKDGSIKLIDLARASIVGARHGTAAMKAELAQVADL